MEGKIPQGGMVVKYFMMQSKAGESRFARVTAPQRIPPDREYVDEHLNAVVQHAHFRGR